MPYAILSRVGNIGVLSYPVIGIYFNGTTACFKNDQTGEPLVDPGTGDFVIEWNGSIQSNAQSCYVLGTWDGSDNGGIDIFFAATDLTVFVSNAGSAQQATLTYDATAQVDDGIVHRWAVIGNRTAQTLSVQLDGVEVESVDFSDLDGIDIQTSYLNIGETGPTPISGSHYKGLICGLHWMNGTVTPTTGQTFTANAYSVALWPMTEASGDITDTVNAIVLADSGTPSYQQHAEP